VNKAIDVAFVTRTCARTKIDVWLNGQALFDPVFKWCLSDLKINLADKSYSRDNRLKLHYSVTLNEWFRTSMSAYLFCCQYSADLTWSAHPSPPPTKLYVHELG